MQYDVVKAIEFRILSSEEIRKQSCVEITSTKDFNGKTPVSDGLFDLRLGSIDLRHRCQTCQHLKYAESSAGKKQFGSGMSCSNNLCTHGHTGHLDLVTECFHPGFIGILVRLLHVFCYFCSGLLVQKTPLLANEMNSLNKEERIKTLSKLSKSTRKNERTCMHCGGFKPIYKKKGSTFVERLWKNTTFTDPIEQQFANLPFTPKIAKRILQNAARADYEFMGIEKMFAVNSILDCLPVMSPIYRPIQDDLTLKLSKIREVNDLFKKFLNDNKSWGLLNVEENYQTKVRESMKANPNLVATPVVPLSIITSEDATVTPIEQSPPIKIETRGRKKRKDMNPDEKIYKLSRDLQLQLGTFYRNSKLGEDNKAPSSSIMVSNNTYGGGNPYAAGGKTKTKNLNQRLKGKNGRFRANLSGKRVDFSGRVCITPDGTLDLDQVGIPVQIALVLTILETVTNLNIQKLNERVKIGFGKIAGAKSVWFKSTNSVKKLAYAKPNMPVARLTPGDKVERYLQNDDMVLMNRQPSLHKQSIMAHRVYIVPENTLRLNLTVTTPYNADFDGDEMNLHVCQSVEAHAEMQELVSVCHQSLNAQSNKPLFGFKQDSLIGWYLMSRKDCFLTRDEFTNLMMHIRYPDNFASIDESYGENEFMMPIPTILKPKLLWTGKQMFSKLLPTNFDFDKLVRNLTSSSKPLPRDESLLQTQNEPQPTCLDEKERHVIIRDGEMLTGQLCKETLGATKKSIFHLLSLNYKGKQFTDFASDAQRIVNIWFDRRGFSVGMKDLTISEPLRQMVRRDLDLYFDHFKGLQSQFSQDLGPSGCNTANSSNYDPVHAQQHRVMYKLEPNISQSLNRVLVDSQRYLDELTTIVLPTSDAELSRTESKVGAKAPKTITIENSMLDMVVCGSKGSIVNLCQMVALVGQNEVEGQRIHPIKSEYPGYDLTYARSLPCYDKYDFSYFKPQSHGFVDTSYMEGLNQDALFFQTAAGRAGLVNTAVKASVIGYANRRIVKAAEGVVVQYDKTVRDLAKNRVIQFSYGGDNLDAGNIQTETLPFLTMTNDSLTHYYKNLTNNGGAVADINVSGGASCDADVKTLVSSLEMLAHDIMESKQTINDLVSDTNSNTILLSLDIRRQIKMFLSKSSQNVSCAASRYSNSVIFDDKTFTAMTSKSKLAILFVYCNQLLRCYGKWPTMNFRAAMMWFVTQHHTFKRVFTSSAFINLVENLTRKFVSTQVAAGEAVGLLAAASIGEPVSQMTFNTFHLAGLSSSNVTLGFARLIELIQLVLKIKTPSSRLILKSDDTIESAGPLVGVALESTGPSAGVALSSAGSKSGIPIVYFHQIVSKGKIIIATTSTDNDLPPQLNSSPENQFGWSKYKLVYKFKDLSLHNLTPFRVVEILRQIFGVHHLGISTTSDGVSFQILNFNALQHLALYETKKRKSSVIGGDNESTLSTPQNKILSTPKSTSAIDKGAEVKKIDSVQVCLSCLTGLQNFLTQSLPLQGLPGIQHVETREQKMILPSENSSQRVSCKILDTFGSSSNLGLLWLLDNVEWRYSVSNNLHEINSLLGIEAATYTLFHELKNVLGSFGGSGLDERHILLLADIMTNNGILMPLSRFGYKNTDMSIFQQASFEKQPDVLYEAAFYNSVESFAGVSTSIFLGQSDKCAFGTGICDVIYDKPSFCKMNKNETQGTELVYSNVLERLSSTKTETNVSDKSNVWKHMCQKLQCVFMPSQFLSSKSTTSSVASASAVQKQQSNATVNSIELNSKKSLLLAAARNTKKKVIVPLAGPAQVQVQAQAQAPKQWYFPLSPIVNWNWNPQLQVDVSDFCLIDDAESATKKTKYYPPSPILNFNLLQ